MKVLTTTAEINSELVRLIEECATCQVAVAWASIGFKACDLLVKQSSKIARMVVGVHFYQTNPEFIERFREHPNVRFIMRTDGVFHPKVYLFLKAAGEWECLIGSPNFTRGGFDVNDEMAVLISNHDLNAQEAVDNVRARLNTYWDESSSISEDELNIYREAWKRKRMMVISLEGKFGNPQAEGSGDGGKHPLNMEILQWRWPEYFCWVKAEEERLQRFNSMEERLKVMRATRKCIRTGELCLC